MNECAGLNQDYNYKNIFNGHIHTNTFFFNLMIPSLFWPSINTETAFYGNKKIYPFENALQSGLIGTFKMHHSF